MADLNLEVAMKRFLACCLTLVSTIYASHSYQPSPQNLQNRAWFSEARYGLFVHWGASSVLGQGEWVMERKAIKFTNYKKLMGIFNPIAFDPEEWVNLVKASGMNYITFITRHHDGFSNWDTQASDWKITNTPYGKDLLKQLSDECHRQGVKLFLYYSLLDWSRDDYPYESGRTGKKAGRTVSSNYSLYLQFMKDQLTELLTNYGEIAGIWFDGHWDQTDASDPSQISKIDWHYNEIYELIHSLQPQCLIGNNHHLAIIPGEDFQMFEKDLPGHNGAGFNAYQTVSSQVPLETCETINDNWGFHINDDNYKGPEKIVHLLARAAGNGANLLLNVGPMPNGIIQPEFQDPLLKVGDWLKQYGETIYATNPGFIKPQTWGAVTQKGNRVFIHLLNPPDGQLSLPFPYKVKSVKTYLGRESLPYILLKEQLTIDIRRIELDSYDTVIEVQVSIQKPL